MSGELYALIALAARYWFVALIVILLFRGWRMTVSDNRRAKLIREWMGQTGCVGEWIANPGARKRVSYPIPREGVLGSARSADVRIRHRDLRRAHAHFELREGGLLVKPLGSAQLSVGGGHTGEAVFLQNGDVLSIGGLQLMLVLFDAQDAEDEAPDEWFEVSREPDETDGDEREEDDVSSIAYAAPYAAYPAERRPVKKRTAESPFQSIQPKRGGVVSKKAGMPSEPKRGRVSSQTIQENPLFQPIGAPIPGGAMRGIRRNASKRNRQAPDGADAWFHEPTPANRAQPDARRAAAKKRSPDDFFNEDEIWRDQ